MKPMIRSVKKFNKHHVVLDRDDQHFMQCRQIRQNVVCMRAT